MHSTKRVFPAAFKPCDGGEILRLAAEQKPLEVTISLPGEERVQQVYVQRLKIPGNGSLAYLLFIGEVRINTYEDIPYSYFMMQCSPDTGIGSVRFCTDLN